MENKKITVIDNANERIDKYISMVDNELSRSYLQRLLKEESVKVNGKVVKANYKVSISDEIEYHVPDLQELGVTAENIPLDIIYEDKDIIVINKPKDMVVHPAAGHTNDTLVNALLYHCKDDLSGINGVMRPGIVHRIDKDTTGVLVICKNDNAHTKIAEQLKEHSTTRKYEAIVYDNIKDDDGLVDAPIGRNFSDRKRMSINRRNGKPAITHYRVLERLGGKYTHIECSLETGRTHQIRVHMSSIKHPLLGDTVYGPSKDQFKLQGQALHAKTLGFIHPTTNEYVEFSAPVPDYFDALLLKLR
ncbi:MAG: pseudouridine synthase, RluA family [Clostridiales bacterium]|nr:pseudouridine synthase, RluA family [Clostridiales bacterium]